MADRLRLIGSALAVLALFAAYQLLGKPAAQGFAYGFHAAVQEGRAR